MDIWHHPSTDLSIHDKHCSNPFSRKLEAKDLGMGNEHHYSIVANFYLTFIVFGQ